MTKKTYLLDHNILLELNLKDKNTKNILKGLEIKKKCAPHEPEEEVLSAADAFKDAELSEARWQTFESLDSKLLKRFYR